MLVQCAIKLGSGGAPHVSSTKLMPLRGGRAPAPRSKQCNDVSLHILVPLSGTEYPRSSWHSSNSTFSPAFTGMRTSNRVFSTRWAGFVPYLCGRKTVYQCLFHTDIKICAVPCTTCILAHFGEKRERSRGNAKRTRNTG